MPAVLKPEMWPAWLGEQPATLRDLKAMLAPYPFREHGLLAGERARRQCQE
jgi:putative SOS response-associated peptidase YedK